MENNKFAVKLGLPKGKMQEGVFSLLKEGGIRISTSERAYRPRLSEEGFEAKLLKPQNIIEMLDAGSRDIGFAGGDWVRELNADLVELLDTGLDPVSLVAAAPQSILKNGSLPRKKLVIASEYERITRQWIKDDRLDAVFLRSYGATEVFPPEDADCIVDNTASGETLRSNNLLIVKELMNSSTRLYANRRAMEDMTKRQRIEDLVLVLRSVLEARERVMVEINVSAKSLNSVMDILPALKEPTVSKLRSNDGFAVKAAVKKKDITRLVPLIKAQGGEDIFVFSASQIVR